jgi:hypothetical protein
MRESSYPKILFVIGVLGLLSTTFLLLETQTSTDLLSYQFDNSLYDESGQADVRSGLVEFLVHVVIDFFRI